MNLKKIKKSLAYFTGFVLLFLFAGCNKLSDHEPDLDTITKLTDTVNDYIHSSSESSFLKNFTNQVIQYTQDPSSSQSGSSSSKFYSPLILNSLQHHTALSPSFDIYLVSINGYLFDNQNYYYGGLLNVTDSDSPNTSLTANVFCDFKVDKNFYLQDFKVLPYYDQKGEGFDESPSLNPDTEQSNIFKNLTLWGMSSGLSKDLIKLCNPSTNECKRLTGDVKENLLKLWDRLKLNQAVGFVGVSNIFYKPSPVNKFQYATNQLEWLEFAWKYPIDQINQNQQDKYLIIDFPSAQFSHKEKWDLNSLSHSSVSSWVYYPYV